MALQKWGGRGSDDIGAAVLREEKMMRGNKHIAGSWVCRVFRFGVVCVVFIVSGCRMEKNERHFAWLLIALLVCRNLILYVCDCFCLVFVWHLSFIFSQWGGAIHNEESGDLKFEGSATFTSCSAVASSSSDDAYAVSGGE